LLREVGAGDLIDPINPVLAIARGSRLHEIDLAHPLRSVLHLGLLSRGSTLRLARILPGLIANWQRCSFETMATLAPLDRESVRDYAMRVLGQETHDHLIDPLIRVNMFNSTAVSSVADLFWVLRMFADTRIVQVKGGMGAMSRALAATLDVRCGQPVTRVETRSDGVVLTLKGADERMAFDAAVVAVPPPRAIALVPELRGPLADWFNAVTPVRSVTVQLGLTNPPATRAAMVMVPAAECPDLLGIVLDHNKSPDRVPAGKGMITAHLSAGFAEHDDADAVAAALRTLSRWFGDLENQIEMRSVHRWDYVDHARPVGTYQRLAPAVAQSRTGRIMFAGEFPSAGIEGAVIAGRRAAEATFLHDQTGKQREGL
jgi:oxygen-dependent protoporphyrinogen oxidase